MSRNPFGGPAGFVARRYEPGQVWGSTAVETTERKRRELTAETADRVGAMLWSENVVSVAHRYKDCADHLEGRFVTEWPGPIGFDPIGDVAGYRFERIIGRVDPLVVLNAIDGYEYQSCEHPRWRDSEAFAFCDVLRRIVVQCVPGIDKAGGWSIESRDVFR